MGKISDIILSEQSRLHNIMSSSTQTTGTQISNINSTDNSRGILGEFVVVVAAALSFFWLKVFVAIVCFALSSIFYTMVVRKDALKLKEMMLLWYQSKGKYKLGEEPKPWSQLLGFGFWLCY